MLDVTMTPDTLMDSEDDNKNFLRPDANSPTLSSEVSSDDRFFGFTLATKKRKNKSTVSAVLNTGPSSSQNRGRGGDRGGSLSHSNFPLLPVVAAPSFVDLKTLLNLSFSPYSLF